jgi:Family of unknown function (DUF6929)
MLLDNAAVIPVRKAGDLTLSRERGRSRHISAASGLVRLGDHLFVVADDELGLGVFSLDDAEDGYMVKILDGRPPGGGKADLESLVALPSFSSYEHGALLALGSGSQSDRRSAAFIPLESPSVPSESHLLIDLADLYEELARELPALNIEGATVHGDLVVLLQRGNDPKASNARIDLALEAVLSGLERSRSIPASAIASIVPLDLGRHRGIDLAFSDISGIEDGRLVFVASTEASGEGVDGKVVGSSLGVMDPGGEIAFLEPVDIVDKIEGLAARLEPSGIEVLMVVDADDPDSASPLLAATLPL